MDFLKKLREDRATKQAEMQKILDAAKTENRAMSKDDVSKFDTLESEIKSIDSTISAEERALDLEKKTAVTPKSEKTVEERAEAEERAFDRFLRGTLEERTDDPTDVNFTTTDNGTVIPKSIANKIIKKVYDISPVYQMATRYNAKGELIIPYYDESTQSITMSYADEFTDATSTSGKFTNISLKGYLARALTKVSQSLMNNSNFNLLDFIVSQMGENIAKFIEKELIKGTTSKVTGLSSGVTQKITSASATAITADELMDVQDLVPDTYQGGAVWIMNRKTRSIIRKLKDSDGNYLLNKDFSAKWGYTLLGKDVYCSDNVDEIAATKDAVFYGDLTGLAVKVSEEVNVQVLREKYAEQHAVGVLGFVEFDAKVENAQKLSKLTIKTA